MGDKDKLDSKSKKTISKIGKLFGVLEPPKTNASSTDLPSTKNHSTSTHAISNNEDFIISQQENDLVSPLPKETLTPTVSSRANTPGTRSPNHNLSGHASPDLATSNEGNGYLSFEELQQPKPSASVTDANLQKINSSLLNLSTTPLAAPNPRPSPSVSRNSSVHVPRKQMASPVTKSTPVSRASSTKAKTSSNPNITSHASSTSIPSLANQAAAKPRFRMLENGSHEHNLRSAKRQEKLSNMLKDLLGAKKLRDEAKSAVPTILKGQLGQAPANPKGADKPPTLFAGLVNHIKNNTSPYHAGTQVDDSQNPIVGSEPGTILETVPYLPTNANSTAQDSRSFVQKYGRCQEVIGRGSFGVVRICHKKPDLNSQEEMLYAVKEFKRKPNESDQKYNRRLTLEFCISSSLKNINIIETLDLLKDAKGDYCEVMEFCSGGDLYTLIIASNKLEYAEADCFFKQLIRGVNYMHDMGVSHRDLKPENILLTQNGIIKITDFGNGECFKMAWEDEVQLSEGICGSSPYIAPEEFTQSSFDPRGVDIWACGVIYMAMRTGRQLWKLANPKKDEFFEEYLVKRKAATGYDPIESLKRARCRNVIYSILDPKPERRITGKQILNSEWGREIKVCEAGEGHAV